MKLNCLRYKFYPSFHIYNMFPEDEPNYCIVCRGHVGPENVTLLFFGVINVLNVDKENMHFGWWRAG